MNLQNQISKLLTRACPKLSPVGLKPTTNGRVKTSHPERVF